LTIIIMLTTAIFALGLTAVNAQHDHDHHCETPPVWGGEVIKRIDDKDQDKDRQNHFGIKMKFYQDAEHHRVATFDVEEDHRDGPEHPQQHIYMFDHEHNPHGDHGIEFRINLKTKDCTSHDLDEEFRPIEIPQDAEHYAQQYIGASGVREGSVLVNRFGLHKE